MRVRLLNTINRSVRKMLIVSYQCTHVFSKSGVKISEPNMSVGNIIHVFTQYIWKTGLLVIYRVMRRDIKPTKQYTWQKGKPKPYLIVSCYIDVSNSVIKVPFH